MSNSLPLTTAPVTWSDTSVGRINSVTFMRPREIQFAATACKPLTKLYAFFDDVRVDAFVTPAGKILGAELITDVNGTVSGVFSLPANRFNVGVRSLILSQNPTASNNGHATGDAAASFQSFGYAQSLKKTTTSVTQNASVTIKKVITLPPSDQTTAAATTVTSGNTSGVTAQSGTGLTSNVVTTAPGTQPIATSLVYSANQERSYTLAQSFNTFGLVDGVFITSVDVYFKSKSATAPVILELRNMRAGFPTENLVSEQARVVVQSALVQVSETANSATRFTFDFPIYLAPSSDYCFVVRSNSTEYNLYVAEVGGVSIENGKMISEQPFVGSLMRSENNNTWTAEQYKDIKFKINRAKFNTQSTAFVNTTIKPVPYLISGKAITTFVGSRIIRVDCNYYKHGLDSSSKVNIQTNGHPEAVYNGYTDENMNGIFDVTRIISDYAFEFRLTNGSCTRTGNITTVEQVTAVQVQRGGNGYTKPLIELVGGGGSGATATATVVNGSISAVLVTSFGNGYTYQPTVVIQDPAGAGAVLVAEISTYFKVTTNNVTDVVVTNVATRIVSGTDIRAELSLTAPGYAPINTQPIQLEDANYIGRTAIVVSDENEAARLGGTESTVLTHSLYSGNDYVSPMIYLKGSAVITSNFHLNQQTGETIGEGVTNGSGSVLSVTLGNSGSSYTGAPTVVIADPDTAGETATAIATVAGGVITEILVTSAGSGYTSQPRITITGGGGVGAAAAAVLTKFNTELLPSGGTALSRYISNVTGLAAASTGATVYVDAYSDKNSSFEVYLRTTLAADTSNHSQQAWRLMNCNNTRNLSTLPEQVLEYKFELNNLPEFDTFDIKLVLRGADSSNPPIIKSYRAIILA